MRKVNDTSNQNHMKQNRISTAGKSYIIYTHNLTIQKYSYYFTLTQFKDCSIQSVTTQDLPLRYTMAKPNGNTVNTYM